MVASDELGETTLVFGENIFFYVLRITVRFMLEVDLLFSNTGVDFFIVNFCDCCGLH